jgi:diguanylate cyclase (GGDEF)-like protein
MLVLTAVVVLVARSVPPTGSAWLLFGTLSVAVTLHLVLVKRSEEDRRDAAPVSGPVFAVTSVWTFAAVIALPVSLAVAVALLVRVLTYPIARRQPYKYLFSSAEILASVLAANLLIRGINVQVKIGTASVHELAFAGTLVAAGALYLGVQAVAVAFSIKLSVPTTPWKVALGSWSDNVIEAISLCAGVALGMLMTDFWIGPLLALIPVVFANQLWDRMRQRQRHLERLLAEQQQAHQQLTKDAHTDYRTGLLNTTGLAEYANRLAERCRINGQPVTLLAIDLDHFKRINDTWGHPAGNAVLAEVGRILREKLRPGDVAGRDGGEEFVVVLADTPLAQGVAIAERIREAIAELSVPTTDKHRNIVTLRGRGLPRVEDGGPDQRAISASLGVCILTDAPDALPSAQHSADAALYIAKENGRNRVQVANVDIGASRLPSPRDEQRVTRSA